MLPGASRAAHEDAQGRVPRDLSPALPSAGAGSRIELVERIGRGSISEVWSAHWIDGAAVALKRLGSEWARQAAACSLLRDEAECLSDLSHRTIVSFVAWLGADTPIAGGNEAHASPAIVMELLEGGNFVSLAGAAPRHWLPAACEVLEALEYLHARGIVHGDVKATNVLFDRANRPRLIDFSCAGRIGETAGHRVGTPSQQRGRASGHVVSIDDDAFAFAALVYELMSGRPPFAAAGPAASRRVRLDLKPQGRYQSKEYSSLQTAVLEVLSSSEADGEAHLAACKRALLEANALAADDLRDS